MTQLNKQRANEILQAIRKRRVVVVGDVMLDEFGKHLAKHGLKFSDGPTMKEDGGGIAFIDAPEGYEIELIQRGRKPGTGY